MVFLYCDYCTYLDSSLPPTYYIGNTDFKLLISSFLLQVVYDVICLVCCFLGVGMITKKNLNGFFKRIQTGWFISYNNHNLVSILIFMYLIWKHVIFFVALDFKLNKKSKSKSIFKCLFIYYKLMLDSKQFLKPCFSSHTCVHNEKSNLFLILSN